MKTTRLLRHWLILALSLGLLTNPVLAVTSLQYTLPGTTTTFGDTATVAWTLSNRASGTGQYSNRFDKGAGAQPSLWAAHCQISLTGTNVLGTQIEYYIAHSDGTNQDAGFTTTTNTFTSDQRRVLTRVGTLSVYQTTTNTTMFASFRNLYIPGRFFQMAMWNNSGLPTETSTTKHLCTLFPMPIQMQ
jgi:hypothetical protein